MGIKANFPFSIKSVEEFIRILLPEKKDSVIIANALHIDNKIIMNINIDNQDISMEEENFEHLIDDQKTIMLKGTLLKSLDKKYPWGSLIGVRPTKMVRRFMNFGISQERMVKILKNMYLVDDKKINLLMNIIETEDKLLNKNAMNMYIGIPFCPTKCNYCSFASYEIGSSLGKFYEPFVNTLIEEIKLVGEFAKEKKHIYESIYIGGGTPSTLTTEDMERILTTLHEKIDLKNVKEFTFEAGREDTLTSEKLEILKKYGVDRISLNPQTFKEETLEKINRKFNRKHFDEMYQEIKKMGFILNMDLIIGLPNETIDDILKTLDEIEKYEIENLTIHSLSKKKGSYLYRNDFVKSEVERERIENRIQELVERKGMKPYYMYRQKNGLDWGENVGYSPSGYESKFNIEMIEENQETMGLGGGAISKCIRKESEHIDQIERIVNPKDPALYISEMKERHEKKIKLFSKE